MNPRPTGLNKAVPLVFEGPVHATGKKPEPSQTESEKTDPLFAVVCGFEPVAVAVF